MKAIPNIFLFFLGILFLTACSDNKFQHFPDGEQLCFRLIDGKYISADRNNGNVLHANGDASNAWETFYIDLKENGEATIKTENGYYVSYNKNDSSLTGSAQTPGNEEIFQLVPYKEYFEIHTKDGGKVVMDWGNNRHLKIVYDQPGLLVKIKRANAYPASWFSISEINWWPFFIQLAIFISLLIGVFKLFKNLIKNNRFSYCVVLITGFIMLYAIFNMKRWEAQDVIRQDVINYYGYLPATFIFNDLSFDFTDNLPADFNGHIWVYIDEETQNKVPKFSMGLSIMYLPFFLIGHAMAHLGGYSTYGFSEPYAMMICVGAWFFAFLALFYLRKILLLYFNDAVTSITILGIALCTNLFYYVVVASGMSHAFSFCLFVFFIWNTIKWHEQITLKRTIFIGLLIGLISLIRPTNALLAIVFMLFNVTSLETFKARAKLFWANKNHLLVIAVLGILVWLPQLIFWKWSTGHFFYFSYKGEGFFFDNPHIMDGLFSYRKGWLLYTPIMVFALVGIGFLYKKQKQWLYSLVTFNVLNIYIIFSWWCWWYGGSFGSRPMVESYALLAIPLASFFSYFDQKSSYLKSIPVLLIFITMSLNLFQTQQSKTCLHYDAMSKEAYWTNFTVLGWEAGYDDLMDPPDYDKAIKGLDE